MNKSNARKIVLAVSKALMKSINQTLLMSSPIETVVVNEAIDYVVPLLMGQSQLPRDDIHKKIHIWCRDIISPENEDYLEIICAAVEICLEDIDLLETDFDAANTAEDLSKCYIQRYKRQFDDTDIHYLERNLPLVLEKIILELEIQSEQDPYFQIAWKALIGQRINSLQHEQLFSAEQLIDHERRIADQERQTWKRLSTVAELSEDYRRKWDETLFLDDSVKLREVYQLPYVKNYSLDGEGYLMDTATLLQRAVDPCSTVSSNMLVILGHPGSGKSTLITYLLNNCKIPEGQTVRVHRFTGFERIDWNGDPENLPQHMLNVMGLDINNLNNMLLVLDGLDEIDMLEGHDFFRMSL